MVQKSQAEMLINSSRRRPGRNHPESNRAGGIFLRLILHAGAHFTGAFAGQLAKLAVEARKGHIAHLAADYNGSVIKRMKLLHRSI